VLVTDPIVFQDVALERKRNAGLRAPRFRCVPRLLLLPLIGCEDDGLLRAVLVGTLRDAELTWDGSC